MTTSLLQRMVTAAAIGAIPVFSICVFVPLTLYAGNSGEFAGSYYDFLREIMLYAAIVVTALDCSGRC